jgi:leucyl-tRNA synthetase
MIKGAFNILVVLLVIGYFAGGDSDNASKETVKQTAKVERVEKHWSESEKKQVYDALNKFCSSQNYTCLSGSYVSFSKNGYVSPVVRVQYPITWYATKDIRAVSKHNARAVNNYLKFNTDVTQVKYTIIKVVGINGKETRYGI